MDSIILCTLFDINYIDKGIVLYQSLRRCETNFILYILAMDEYVEDILNRLNLKNVSIVSVAELVDTEKSLLEKQSNRSKGEFCWTCTPILLEYIMKKHKNEICTYIDADLFFYTSPRILIEEFVKSGKAVGLTPHRFPNTFRGKEQLKTSGKYCVEFNTFKNNDIGRKLLTIWKNNVLEKCSIDTGGDQLYLTDWGDKYTDVYDYQNIGGGVAPWNLKNYRFHKIHGRIYVEERGKNAEMVFYHFQGIQYSDDGRININIFAHPDAGFISHKIVDYFYKPYLIKIEVIRRMIKERYGYELYEDGCGRTFSLVRFDLKKFIKSFVNKLKNESFMSAIELAIRVIRKREDIIKVNHNKR